MTGLEWMAFLVLLIVGLAAGAAVTLSNGAVTAAIYALERTYRRGKSLEAEQQQAQVLAQRQAEVEWLLARSEGWQRVLNQVLADALGETEPRVGPEGVLELSAAPAPRFTVAGEDGRSYLFTTSPEALRKTGLIGRKARLVPLDASVSLAARVEVQAVWEHLAAQWLRPEATPALPRRAEWFLVVREGAAKRARRMSP